MRTNDNVGSVQNIPDEDGKPRYYYVAAGEAYKSYIFDEDRISSKEKKHQEAELAYKIFRERLKAIGYLDDVNPIVKIYIFEPYESYTAVELNVDSSEEHELATLTLDFATLHPEWEAYWDSKLCGNIPITSAIQNCILHLQELLKNITNEITRQGYAIDNKHIATLIALLVKKTKYKKLAGNIEDWIPYVYTGVNVDNLLKIFNSETNPDYEKTGRIAISVETAKKLGSMNSSLVGMIL